MAVTGALSAPQMTSQEAMNHLGESSVEAHTEGASQAMSEATYDQGVAEHGSSQQS
jgi:hypothetical protein